jgi:hypothetical protein
MVRPALKGLRWRRSAAQRQAAQLRFGATLDPHTKGFTLTALLGTCGGDLQGLRDAALLSPSPSRMSTRTAMYSPSDRSNDAASCGFSGYLGHPDGNLHGAGVLSIPKVSTGNRHNLANASCNAYWNEVRATYTAMGRIERNPAGGW